MRQLLLASASPRRRLLLREAGFDPVVVAPPWDDASLPLTPGGPAEVTVALAWFKASSVASRRRDGVVLGADTICSLDGEVRGKPRDDADARRMLRGMRNRSHEVWTGVAILGSDSERRLLADRAIARWGDLPDERIDEYVATGLWRGKAGGYNLAERVADGWPIETEGDPATVMGLPMRKLVPILRSMMEGGE